MASPTERADKLIACMFDTGALGPTLIYGSKEEIATLLPPGSQLVTPEDILAGWRVLTPEQAETVRVGCMVAPHDTDGRARKRRKALVLLAGVPGKDSDKWIEAEGDARCGMRHKQAGAVCLLAKGHDGPHRNTQGYWSALPQFNEAGVPGKDSDT